MEQPPISCLIFGSRLFPGNAPLLQVTPETAFKIALMQRLRHRYRAQALPELSFIFGARVIRVAAPAFREPAKSSLEIGLTLGLFCHCPRFPAQFNFQG